MKPIRRAAFAVAMAFLPFAGLAQYNRLWGVNLGVDSKEQILALAHERGAVDVTDSAMPDRLRFKGDFSGIPNTLLLFDVTRAYGRPKAKGQLAPTNQERALVYSGYAVWDSLDKTNALALFLDFYDKMKVKYGSDCTKCDAPYLRHAANFGDLEIEWPSSRSGRDPYTHAIRIEHHDNLAKVVLSNRNNGFREKMVSSFLDLEDGQKDY